MIVLMVSADSAVRELTPFPGAPIARVGIRRVIERMDDTVVPPNFLERRLDHLGHREELTQAVGTSGSLPQSRQPARGSRSVELLAAWCQVYPGGW